MVGKGGPAEQKLESLIKDDFTGAQLAVDAEEKALDSIINRIKSLPVTGVKEGEQLKTAAINFYTAVKAMEIYARKEIEQQALSLDKDEKLSHAAQDSLLQLAIAKKEVTAAVRQKDEEFQKALQAFETANGI
ncbi:hypothetical protein EG028_26480 [Chitinophaga barathri]|uniref:Uncharacterized protein n=2 Tax=Chitinophaga barathri TaxID=1647451 RepID=A0A3N4MEZ7_9BACT|nr:hypothetical protein EG028_26480 [Chitinophaga barathri]